MLFMSRAIELQEQASAKTHRFVELVESNRIAAIIAQEEERANDLLALAAVAKSLLCELAMYIALKRGEADPAWTLLIDAQDWLLTAARASARATNLSAKFDRLREMETWFFPPQQFTSLGVIVNEQHCSICRADYAACDHIAGRAYLGRICSIQIQQASVDHIALVEHPADRRCRITSPKVPGGDRNVMTWRVTPGESKAGNMTAILAVTSAEPKDREGDLASMT